MITTTIDDGFACLTIDMPGRTMNVLTQAFADALEQAVDAVAADRAVTGIIITSGKPAFLAGADLGQMAGFNAPGVTPADVKATAGRYSAVFRKLETCGKPVVGAAAGTALGGGLELLLACHYRIVAEDPKARYGLPEVTLGLLPGAGGTQRLPRMIGLAAAIPILTQGRPMAPAQALAGGIVDAVVPANELRGRAHAVLREGRVKAVQPWDERGYKLPGGAAQAPANADALALAQDRIRVAGGHYPAPLAILRCLHDGAALPIDRGLELEIEEFTGLIQDQVSQNMVRTLFFAKQAADKLRRRPRGVPASRVARLGVVGAGFMGAGIAEVSALAGIEVVLLDRDRATGEQGRARIAESLDRRAARGRLAGEARDAALARVDVAADAAGFAGCDLVIEAVSEDLAVKTEVLRAADAALPPTAVVASNTSALPIGELAGASARPANVIGLHFFSPVTKMALVEVVVGAQTSDETLARALDYVRQIRKTPIVVNDGYGFYTTRCVDAYVREGLRLLVDGLSPAQIEAAGSALGLPVGPLALADEVGIDVLRHVAEGLRAREQGAWADDRHEQVNAVLDRLATAQRFGRKSGAGLYVYPAEGDKYLDVEFLVDFVAARALPADSRGAQERLLMVQALEAARCWADGVITDAGDADLGALLAWAFPAYLGGPLAVIDNLGLSEFLARCDALVQTLGPRFEPPPRLREMAQTGSHFHTAAQGGQGL